MDIYVFSYNDVVMMSEFMYMEVVFPSITVLLFVLVMCLVYRKVKRNKNKWRHEDGLPRSITITVTNAELDAMEDYLTIDYGDNSGREEKDRRTALDVWGRLVTEWDK